MNRRYTLPIACAGLLLALVVPQEPNREAWAIHEACRAQLAEQMTVASDAAGDLGQIINAHVRAVTPLLKSMDSQTRNVVGPGSIRIAEANLNVLRKLLAVHEDAMAADSASWRYIKQQAGITDLPAAACPEVKR